jgi:hypothetical protein
MRSFSNIISKIKSPHLTTIVVVLFIFLISFDSCSDKGSSGIKKEVITKDDFVEIIQKMQNDKALTIEDLDLFTKGISRYGANFDSLMGKTVGQVIESERDFIKDYQLKTLLAQANNLSIHMNLYFKYIGVQKDDNDTLKKNILHFDVKNKSNVPIKRVEGKLEFYDMLNQIVKWFPISIDLELKPDVQERITQVYKYEQKNPRDTTIRSPYVRLQAIWKPTLLEFKNGKKFEVHYPENE